MDGLETSPVMLDPSQAPGAPPMSRIPALLATLAVAAGLAVTVSAPAYADDRRCTGTIRTASIDGDIYVPRGATCTLVGTRVDGNVKVYANATLVARGIKVDGNIQADNHKRVRILPRTLADGRLSRTTVGGNIQFKQGGGGEVRRTRTDGDIQLFTNNDGGKFAVYGNRVGGNLQCKSNTPRPVGANNVVQGNKEGQCRGF
ncbi:hypothetical protein [Georgenia deserti]|uniref:DUF3060 domain-containing protein n=1 Tax=Georgenia deserti TaxID=2093781 RepID=A0ABW4L5F3_9MICO